MSDLENSVRKLHSNLKFTYESQLTDEGLIYWEAELSRPDFLNGEATTGIKSGEAEDQRQALLDAVDSVSIVKKSPWWKFWVK